ncbi:hypothetical protein P12x_003642 [Tundrisphaera lichenicola]|uniref:hypothetical protein n=1 Tax=Tundrisphaera lichenicola TaxID=2029860 RepID=UPI003EB69660
MSAVKIFALGVLLTGTLATRAYAGSMNGTQDSSSGADGQRIAAANLAGNWTGFSLGSPAPATSYLGTSRVVGQPGGLVLGTTESTLAASPLNFGNASFRIANSVPDATPSQPAPVQWQPLAPTSQPAPIPVASTPPAAPDRADAYINFGNSTFADASTLTTGNPQSFLNSPVFSQFYGPGGPTSQDVANFESQVVSTVQKTYNDAGLPIHLTTDPNAPAAHTLSVVSNASNPDNPGAIGITTVGGNGYTFLDKFGYASNPSQLATAVGHNVAHELMHAFGLANHPETGGPYVDAATATFTSLADPNTTFSPAAASLLSTLDFQSTGESISSGSQIIDGAQTLVPDASPVPEPSTVAIWALAGITVIAHRWRKSA